jgi:hypothetical protein
MVEAGAVDAAEAEEVAEAAEPGRRYRNTLSEDAESRRRRTRARRKNTRSPPMSTAIRQASHVVILAARLYRELAVSASELLRPGTYSPR